MVRTLLPLNSRFADFFDEALHGLTETNGGAKEWYSPHLNVVESESGYEISLDVPGLKSEEFNIEFKDGQLWVTGERKTHKEEEGKTYHRVERRFGSFRRVVSLPVDVSADKIEAAYQDGVLTVSVPKSPTAMPRKISVKSN